MANTTPPANGVWTMDQLLATEQAGQALKFIFFWGHTPRVEGQIGHHVFSQWFETPFVVDQVEYSSAEQFMMAEKARLFSDDHIEREILDAESPAEAKALGRKLAGFTHDLWVEHRLDIVVRASVAKFDSTPELRSYLVGTGNRVLVEASPPDRIWGIGLAKDDKRATTPSAWRGENLLGFALMEARAVLAGRSVS